MNRARPAVVTGRMRHSARSIACLLALVAAFALSSVTLAQTGKWSPPQPLSASGETASFPDIAADSAGTLHVAWSASEDPFDLVNLSSSAGGEDWSPEVNVVALRRELGQGYVARPELAIDERSDMYLGVHGPNDRLYSMRAPVVEAENAARWQEGEAIAEGYHIMPVAQGDTLHLFYTQGATSASCQYCLHLFHTQTTDGGESWSEPVDISRRPDRGAAKPQPMISRSGALQVVWESGFDGDRGYVVGPVRTMHSASYDGGETWSAPVQLDSTPNDQSSERVFARNVALAQAGDGTLVAVWWSMPEDLFFYRTSSDDGRTWGSARAIPNVWGVGERSTTRQDSAAMVTDSAGTVHLVTAGRLGADDDSLALLHLSFRGDGWSVPQTIAGSGADLPEWPRAAIALGNRLHLVWHVRPGYQTVESADDAPWQVWESHTILESPALAAVPLPAPVTTQSAQVETVAQAAEPTATPLPKFDRAASASPVSMRTLMSENDDVLILALSLLPVVFLVAGVLLWRRRRA